MAGLAAAGAAAGTAVMPGIGTAVGGVVGALADMMTDKKGGGSGGGGGGEPAPSASAATTAVYGSGLDGSGWSVNFGSGSLTPTYSGGSHEIAATQAASATAAAPGASYLAPQGSNGQGAYMLGQPSAGVLAGVPGWVLGVAAAAFIFAIARHH